MEPAFVNYRIPPDSESRMLDMMVQAEERPYGYTSSPPPADTGYFNERREESKKQYHIKAKR